MYDHSSYKDYIGKAENCLVDTLMALDMIGQEQFIQFHLEENSDACLELEQKSKISDKEAVSIIKQISGYETLTEFQTLTGTLRDKHIGKCKEKGLSIRQISRLTGISFGIVRKA